MNIITDNSSRVLCSTY